MAERLVSIKIVLDRVLRHPLFQDVTLETVIDYTVDFLRIVGVPKMFIEKVANIEIINYKGELPDDWHETIQVREFDSKIVFRYATDTFHMSESKMDMSDYTFKIQGDYIYTSLEEGILEMSYLAMSVDECGYLMVPENSNLLRALEAYIKKQHFTILFDMNKISGQALQQARQDYAWAVGSAEADMNRLDLSKAESFFNSFRTLILRDSEFANSFRESGTKELLRRH